LIREMIAIKKLLILVARKKWSCIGINRKSTRSSYVAGELTALKRQKGKK
jgi:hypothetical protein